MTQYQRLTDGKTDGIDHVRRSA